MKTYLITGGAGFIGANLVRKILTTTSNPLIHIIEPSGTNLWRLADIQDQITIHSLNLIDFKEVENLVLALKPDVIFHLAAYGGMPNEQDQLMVYHVNLYGTINLLNACKKFGFDCFINTGSSSEYGKKSKPMKEADQLEPISDYAVAKVAATNYCAKEAILNKLPIYTVRPFSVYGNYESPTRLIPSVINSFLQKQPLNLSNPSNVRDFIYIDDMIDGYLTLERKKPTNIFTFNIGSGVQSCIQDVVTTLQSLTQVTIPLMWQTTASRPWEPTHWQADIELAQNILSWTPHYSLETGLKKSLDWFTRNQNLYQTNKPSVSHERTTNSTI